MKKLMTVAAAALCAAVGFGADAIESASTVGFTKLEPGASTKRMQAFCFQNVTGGAIDLQSIVAMSKGEVEDGDGAFKIWWWSTDLSDFGNKYAVWSNYWYDPLDPDANEDGYVDADGDESKFCWVVPESEDEEADPYVYPTKWEKSFAAGEGFFVQAGVSSPSLTISGQVVAAPVDEEYFEMKLVASQKKLIANPFPVAWNLQDVVAYSKGDVEDGDGAFKIWWWSTDLSDFGNKYAVWSNYWYDPLDPDANEDGYVDADGDESKFCWVVPESEDEEADPYVYPTKWEKTFAVGEGFYVQPGVSAPSLMFKNPFFKGE